MMFDVMFIFTSSAELQMSLSLLLSGCECCVAFQWLCQMSMDKLTRNHSECCFI
jgi:hypothetical protein